MVAGTSQIVPPHYFDGRVKDQRSSLPTLTQPADLPACLVNLAFQMLVPSTA